jgi:hypothetical protein
MFQSTKGEWAFAGAAAFFALTLPRLLLHELWRDEAWLWLVVTESHSIHELFVPLQRSGEGYLFPLLCFVVRQVTTSPRGMQALHLVLATCGAFVFLRCAPFHKRERLLIVAGYLPFYEYAVISRHYVAGVLLTWLACAAITSRRSLLWLGLFLGLLCQTTVFGFIVAIAIGAGWLFDGGSRRDGWLGGAILVIAGAFAGLVQLIPAPGTSFAPWWRTDWDRVVAQRVLAIPWRGFVPLPELQLNFWNTNILDNARSVELVLGLLALAFAAAMLWPRKSALATFAVGATGLLVFAYLKFPGEMRHQGHIWILFIAAAWLAGPSILDGWRRNVLVALLVVQVGAAVFASWIDVRHPFSNGPAAAAMLRDKGLDAYPLLGFREPPASAVALPLGKPLYFASREVFTTYPDYGPRQRELSMSELRCAARGLAERSQHDIVVVANRELPRWSEASLEGATSGAIVATEDYHLYMVRLDRLAATAAEANCTVTR